MRSKDQRQWLLPLPFFGRQFLAVVVEAVVAEHRVLDLLYLRLLVRNLLLATVASPILHLYRSPLDHHRDLLLHDYS